jgi:hypothetical protein
MTQTDALWLLALAAALHVAFSALQSGTFNAFLARFSLPPIPPAAFPWLGVLVGLGIGIVDGVQAGDTLSASAAKAVVAALTGGGSAMSVQHLSGRSPVANDNASKKAA